MPRDASLVGARCVVHPGRVATDTCPVCERPRCAVDAAQWRAGGCAACVADRPARVPTGERELLVRAGLAGLVVALLGGFVATQYVDTRYFSVVAPGLVGLATSWAVSAATGRSSSGRRTWAFVAIACVAAVFGTALGFRLVPGGQSLVSPIGEVGPPYLAAVVGALAWPALFGPQPRGSRRGQPDGRGTDS